MSDALVYGGIDLINGAYGIGIDSDFGSPQAVTSAVRSLFLDGSVVTGRFSDNRTLTLTVEIRGTSRADLSVKADALAYQVDQATNTLSYTPSGGLTTIWDTFRGQMTAVWDYVGEYNYFRRYQIVMPALPFGRTPSPSKIAVGTTPSVVLDSFEETPEPTYSSTGLASTAMTRTTPAYAGSYSAQATLQLSMVAGAAQFWQWSNTFASTSIASQTLVQMQVYNEGVISSAYGSISANAPIGWQKATLTLTSSGGSSSWSVTPVIGGASTWSTVTWDLTVTPTSTTGSGYSASAVTGYTVRMDGVCQNPSNSGAYFACYYNVDNLLALPPGFGSTTSADAGTYTMAPVAGSARCPVDLRIDRGGTNTVKDLLVYQAPPEAGAGYNPLLVGASPYSTQAGAVYAGTFTVVGSIIPASQALSRNIAVSIQQTQNGTNVGTAWTSGTITTTAGDAYVVFGEVTLPLVGTSASNTGMGYTVTLTTGAAYVRDMFLLDTRGALVWVGPAPLAAAVKYLFVSAPQAATGVGGVFSGSVSDLSDATSVSASARMSGGQLQFSPGSNPLLVCSTQASSDLVVTANYSPRWLTERTS